MIFSPVAFTVRFGSVSDATFTRHAFDVSIHRCPGRPSIVEFTYQYMFTDTSISSQAPSPFCSFASDKHAFMFDFRNGQTKFSRSFLFDELRFQQLYLIDSMEYTFLSKINNVCHRPCFETMAWIIFLMQNIFCWLLRFLTLFFCTFV